MKNNSGLFSVIESVEVKSTRNIRSKNKFSRMTTTVCNPQIPFIGSFPGSFRPQMTIRIRGVIRDYSGR